MAEKPVKPYPTFPLTPHPTGWVKKIRGKVVWIAGHVEPDEALRTWHEKAPALLGHVPTAAVARPVTDAARVTVRELCNRFLNYKHAEVEARGKGSAHYVQYRKVIREFLRHVGDATTVAELIPDHFSTFGLKMLAKSNHAARQAARLIMAVFNHADSEDWIDRPVKFGKKFRKLARLPSKSQRRWLPDLADLWLLLNASAELVDRLKTTAERDPLPAMQFHSMLWLALNCGYGSTDLAELPRELVDLDRAAIDYARGKTGVDRLIPLWPETVAALRDVMDRRPETDHLLFRTREGNPWVQVVPVRKAEEIVSTNTIDNVNQRYLKLARKVEAAHGVKLKRKGEGFYTLRHVHRTIADEAGDQHAAWAIVGHKLPGMADVYVQVRGQRVQKVVDFVRERLIAARRSRAAQKAAAVGDGAKRPARRATPPARTRQDRSRARAGSTRRAAKGVARRSRSA